MLADLKAAWHLRGPSIGPRRLVYVAALILLSGLSDGIGLVLLVPLLNSLGAPMSALTGAAGWLFALLPATLAGLLLLFLGVAVVRAIVARLHENAVARLRFDYAVDLKTRTYAAIANASWSYLRRKRTADFHALFAAEIDRVEHGVQLLLEVPARLVIFLAHIAIGIAIAPAFSALAIALGLCLAWGLRRRLVESRRLGDIVSEAGTRVNREITEFLQALIRRRLKPGGVVYMGYNALPGWAAFSPLRHLLVEHANRAGSEGVPIAGRIDEAIRFLDRLLAANPGFARDNPGIVESFKAMREDDRHYLAHEFFNRDWQPMHFATIARWLAPDVGYACSADYADHIDAMGLSAAQRSLLADVADVGLRETVKDLIVNPRFRRDYWVKGTERLSTNDRTEALRREQVIAVVRPLELPLKLRAALALSQSGPGEAVYGAVLEVLGDGKVWSLGQIAEAAILIASCDLIQAAQDEQVTAQARPRTDRLNAHLIASARTAGDVHALASPVTGGGIPVGRAQQLFLAELRAGKKRPDRWAREVAKILPAEPLASLIDQARAFADGELPTLRALQVV